MLITVHDRTTYKITQREYTDEGFLKVPGRAARTGIQEYLAGELGLDGDPNRIVKVMRPAEEVFKDESLNSYKGADVTIEHPRDMVDSTTFKKVSAGISMSEGARDGDFVVTDLLIKDEEAIKAIKNGKVQLSAGYTANYDDNVPEGADYEFIQRDIRINHVALVDRARAGAQARLYDKKPNENKAMKVTLDNGQSVEVADESTAMLITGTIDRLSKENEAKDSEIEGLKKKAADAEAKADKTKEELEDEKKKSEDSAISARVAEVIELKDSCKKVGGEKFSCDSLDSQELKKAALKEARPNLDWDSKDELYINAAFDVEMEKESDDEDEKSKDKNSNDSHKNLAKDINDAANKDSQVSPKAKFEDSLRGSWKKTVNAEA